MHRNPIDMLLDENNTDPIVLYNENDRPVAFTQIALIPLLPRIFAILKPVEPMTGVADDEAIVFEIVEEDGQQVIVVVEDMDVIDAVFEEYRILLKEADE